MDGGARLSIRAVFGDLSAVTAIPRESGRFSGVGVRDY